VLVASLLVQNPTAVVGRKETTAEPVASAPTTRARSRRIATATAALSKDILVYEIFVRLPAKDILRCRAVCRSWRSLTSAPDFLLAHHRGQPSFPLLTLNGADITKDGSPICNHSRALLGLDDYEGFKLLASCDGLLLFSLSNGRFSICNPTTRQCAPLPCLTAAGRINIVALYLHSPSGEYRVLYWKGRQQDHHLKAAYYILKVRQGQLSRCIGVPSSTAGIDKIMLDWHETTTNFAPPVVFRNCLHWNAGCDAGILVFDNIIESFRLMRSPAAATRICNHLCAMEGSIAFSCHDGSRRRIIKIWVLEDYEREVWSFKYHVTPSVESFYYDDHLVLSQKGNVLVYKAFTGRMFHCDSTGKLLEEFQCDSPGLSSIGHWFKESLVKHDISLRRGCARVFQRV
jgi:F-box interacting protein